MSNYQTPNYKTPKKQNIELPNADYKTSKLTKGRITKRRKLQKVEKQKVKSNKIIFFFLKIFYFFVLFYSMTTPWRGIEQGTVRLLATPLLATNNKLHKSRFSVILSRGYAIIVNFINIIGKTDTHSGGTSECILMHVHLPYSWKKKKKKKRSWQNHHHQHNAENIENDRKRKKKQENNYYPFRRDFG